MSTRRRFLIVVAACAAAVAAVPLAPSATAARTAAVDLTGKWAFTVVTDQGTGTPSVTLKQAGEKLTGHYSSQTLGEADFEGTVKDKEVTIPITVSLQGNEFVITYTGTWDGADAIKGSVDLAGAASGTFTAKRQPQ